jgi:molybdopterin synthase catalytic subunit
MNAFAIEELKFHVEIMKKKHKKKFKNWAPDQVEKVHDSSYDRS